MKPEPPAPETMTVPEVQEFLHLGSEASARAQLARWRIRPVGFDPSTGRRVFPAQAIRDRAAQPRLGPGFRSDKAAGKAANP